MSVTSKSVSPRALGKNGTQGLRKKYLDHEFSYRTTTKQEELAVPMNLDAILNRGDRGPDIQWNPSISTYKNRVQMLANLNLSRPNSLPEGFPERISAPWAWSGPEFRNEEYILRLQEKDILEIETALSFFKGLQGKLGPGDISCETFPLPKLEKRLRKVAETLHSGRGFSVLRGLDPFKYSTLDNVLIYLGITSYIAETRGVQDSSGNMLIHVKDLGDKILNSRMRQSPYANNAQPFHNDVCDILAMYVQEQAAEGGESHLASCAQIYNEIASTRPDVIQVLSDPSWIFDKHRTPAFWHTRALLFNFEGKGPGFCFSRRPITGSPTSPRSFGVPPMTEVQAEALDMVHFLAVKHQVTMRLQRGDIQLINNLAIQHARSDFRDNDRQQRHIIRLWLRNEKLAWPTPSGLQRTWFEKYGNSERRKIARWNILPGATRERVLFRSDSCS